LVPPFLGSSLFILSAGNDKCAKSNTMKGVPRKGFSADGNQNRLVIARDGVKAARRTFSGR
jgi:hypothetical protein